MKKSTASDFFESTSPPEIDRFIELSMDIAVHAQDILDKKGWSQRQLAAELNKNESEISKWFSGMHNMTLKSIAKLEMALHEKLIYSSKEMHKIKPEIRYVTLKVYGGTNDQEEGPMDYNQLAIKGDIFKKRTA